MEQIVRKFKVMRGTFEMIYPFTTFSCVFEAEKLPESPNKVLQKYLRDVLTQGVPPGERASVSQLPKIMVEKVEVQSDFIEMARLANYRGLGKGQHECVQNYLLLNDPHTIAIEIPVWDENHLGHIDNIRIKDDKIGVWDFKPNAAKETKASGQVLRYVLMLSKALNLPLRMFEGGYYDDTNAYLIKF